MKGYRAFFRRYRRPLLLLAALRLVSFIPCVAPASTAGGGLPWDSPLTTLKNDITGPVAFTISLLGVVAAGAALVFGCRVALGSENRFGENQRFGIAGDVRNRS